MYEKFGISADEEAKTFIAEIFFNPDGTNRIVGLHLFQPNKLNGYYLAISFDDK